MHPMYPIGPDGGGMFFGLVEQKLNAAELSDALTRAVITQDVNRARALFDHAFWHQTAFKPDWFHLYQAVETQNRPMVKLLTAYGATWTEEQAKILTVALADKLDGLTGVLHAAGIRTDYTQKDLQRMDMLPALHMNKRIIDENKKNGVNTAAEEKRFSHAVQVSMANAVMRNDMRQAKQALALHPDAQNPDGYDVSGIFADVLGDFLHSSSQRAITFLDRLQAEGIKLQPVRLDSISTMVMDQHYDLLPPLETRGLLQEDQQKLREHLVSSWPFLQSEIDLDGYKMHISEHFLSQRRTQYNLAAQTLCTEKSTLTRQEVDRFLRQHETRSQTMPQGVANMDQALLASGFFKNPAFEVADLKALADTQGLDAALSCSFNKMAARRQIADKAIDSLLHPKRFDILLQALEAGVIEPNADETEQIVDYLHRRMKKETPAPETIAALKALKNAKARFGLVERRDYLGHSKPGMAKALLDLDIITPHQINRVRLHKRCGGGALLSQPKDKYHDMCEFMCQVELERSAPEEYKPLRGNPDISYQALYLKMRIKQVLPRMRGSLTEARQRRADLHAAALRRVLQRQHEKRKFSDETHETLKRILEQRKNPPKPPKPPKPRFGY